MLDPAHLGHLTGPKEFFALESDRPWLLEQSYEQDVGHKRR